MEQSQKPQKHNGFIYGRGTKKGFLRMQRLGIPRPLFRIENKLTRILARIYRTYAAKMLRELKDVMKQTGMVTDGHDESLDSLLSFFEQMSKEVKSTADEVNHRANMAAVQNSLEALWEYNEQPAPEAAEIIKSRIEKSFKENQADYLSRLQEDASDKLVNIINNFTIDKQQLFDENMDRLKELFLNNSVERIQGEEDYLKRKFLKALNDYITGETETLDINRIVNQLANHSEHMARFFARDQLARLNKAVTIATYESAKVTKVKWVTAGDSRVRESHRALNGRIFDINHLPSEVDDYNCRCGLVPVEYED